MKSSVQPDTESIAASYLGWWRDAGVDVLTSPHPHNWLETKPRPTSSEPAASQDTKADPPPIASNQPTAAEAVKTIDRNEWPSDIETLVRMLKDKAPLPGNEYGGNVAVPAIAAGTKTMLIGDIPDQHDIEDGQFGTGQAGDLASRMMQAIGISPGDYSSTALSTTRPATGALTESDLPLLAEFMCHQIGLVKPETAIIFGSTACQALLSADIVDMRGSLHYFNHNVHKVAAVTTFHPRTLLARPQMKRQAWKDLQVLI